MNDINEQIENDTFDLKTERRYGAYEYMWMTMSAKLGPQWRTIKLQEKPNEGVRKL